MVRASEFIGKRKSQFTSSIDICVTECKWVDGWYQDKVYSNPPPPPTIFLPQAMLGSLCHQFSFLSTWGPVCRLEKREIKYTLPWYTAVIKRRGPGISSGYYACGPRLFSWENRRKIEPNEIPCHFIPCLLVVFNRQHKILVTSVIGSLCTATPPLKKLGRGNRSLFFGGE